MKFLIGVPVHNEEHYVQGVLVEVRRYCDNIFVVNDGSTDATAARLAELPWLTVHTHPVNEGYGQSIIDIFDHARAGQYDWVITLDADEQHEPRSIADFMRVAGEDEIDIVSGSRYMEQSLREGQAPDDRRWINCQITELLSAITSYDLTDSFCGFKAYRVSGLAQLSLTEKGYSMPLQFWIQAARAGLTVKEMPVKLIYKDMNRKFGSGLDQSEKRLKYYLGTISREIGREVSPMCDGRKVGCTCR
jgi:dolichol-phosphate mannosyltransferase